MSPQNLIFITLSLLTAGSLTGAPLKTAVVSKKVKEVRVSKNSAQARDISVGESISGSSTILTGRGSRAELSFPDQTITRIGANSVFRFSSESRDMEIEKGSFLLQVPKNAGGARIRTATVTAAITGTTTMMEYSPDQWMKFICLEGEAELMNKFGEKMKVKPGMMVIMHPNAKRFPRPVVVNLQKLVKTSKLTNAAAFGKLSAPAKGRINRAVNQQLVKRRGGNLIPTGIIVQGPGPNGGLGSEGGEGGGSGGPSSGGGSPRNHLGKDPQRNPITPSP